MLNEIVLENLLVSVVRVCHQEETNAIVNEINTRSIMRLRNSPRFGCGREIWIHCSTPNTLDEDAQ